MNGHPKHLIPKKEFVNRLLVNILWGLGIMFVSLCIGVVGYHYTADLSWVDAFENASMILTGMGPVARMTTTSAKVFASCYALFSGVVFLTTMAFVFSPVVHRLLHKFHLQEK